MKSTKKPKQSCEQCESQNLKSRITTYPMAMGQKQIQVGLVAVKECLDCHYLVPTNAGKAKIARCLGTLLHVFD